MFSCENPAWFGISSGEFLAARTEWRWLIRQWGLVLAFVDPPDVFGAVGGFVCEIPASVEEGGGLHLLP